MSRKKEEEDGENRQTQTVLLFKQTQKEVQGLQAFAFSIVTINDEHTKPAILVIIFWNFIIF